MPNVNASANVSVWNNHNHRQNSNYFDEKLKHKSGYCHDSSKTNLQFANWSEGGQTWYDAGKVKTKHYRFSACLKPNSSKSQLVKDTTSGFDGLIIGEPCPKSTSASYNKRNPGNEGHLVGHGKLCTYNNLSANTLVELSKDINATKHTKDGKDGKTLYEQLLRQYCGNSNNILNKVANVDKYNRCIDISENPTNVTSQNPNIIFSSNLKGFVTSDMKADFCKENPQNQYCACYNTLNLNCRSREHMDKPGCKEYHTFLKGDQSKEDPDIKDFVKTSGTTLTHCLAIKDGTPVCAKSGVFVEPSKVEYLKSCPPNVMCNIHQNFSGAEIQANNFNNNQECNVKSESQVIVSPDGSSSSQSFVSTIAPNTGVNSDDGAYSIPTEPNTNTSEKTKTENDFNNLLIAVFFLFIMGGSSMMAVALIASMK